MLPRQFRRLTRACAPCACRLLRPPLRSHHSRVRRRAPPVARRNGYSYASERWSASPAQVEVADAQYRGTRAMPQLRLSTSYLRVRKRAGSRRFGVQSARHLYRGPQLLAGALSGRTHRFDDEGGRSHRNATLTSARHARSSRLGRACIRQRVEHPSFNVAILHWQCAPDAGRAVRGRPRGPLRRASRTGRACQHRPSHSGAERSRPRWWSSRVLRVPSTAVSLMTQIDSSSAAKVIASSPIRWRRSRHRYTRRARP